MKRFTSLILSILLVVSLFSFVACGEKEPEVDPTLLEGSYTKDFAGTTLKVYNWGEYISDGAEGSIDVVRAFEEVTGINVEYSYYDDNETMYSELASGASYYDIIIPSDYMIQRLIREDMLEKVDVSKLSNYKYISDEYKDLYFDPANEYSVPYNVGMVGLIYNTTMVEKAPDSWEALWDSELSGNILMFKNPRDSFAIAQQRLGIDLNTLDKAEWDKAAELLKEQRELVQSYVMDEVFNKMEGANAAVAPYYAGDFLSMQENNPDLAFVYPKEGVNIFCDSICVPSNAQNYDAALLFMNFMMEPVIALANAEYICYASPNTAVINNDDYKFKGNAILYPSEENKPKTQWFHDLDGDIVGYYENLWVKIRNS
ncbi:MAG: spermidine/putrescine ABC transporter substrate-binding protein [Clostridia bacterium]|nr:spermidine/putrescine ABC transporter substrate-binding protein [Clostridia bacterium]